MLSFILFAFIFYSQAGVSGGDIAIVIFNLMAGIIYIIMASVYLALRKSKDLSAVIITIIISQIAEMIIFVAWGSSINDFIKHFKH